MAATSAQRLPAPPTDAPLPHAFLDLLSTLVRAPSVTGAEHTLLQVPTSGHHTMDEAAPIESVQAFLTVTAALAAGELRP